MSKFPLNADKTPDPSLADVDFIIGPLLPTDRKSISIERDKSLNFNTPLLPTSVSINLIGMIEKLLVFAELKYTPNKLPDNFEVYSPSSMDNPICIKPEHTSLLTNVPLILIRLKVGRADRLFLFYTLADAIFKTYTKSEFEEISKKYSDIYLHDRSHIKIFEIRPSFDTREYDHNAFMNDPANAEYLQSVTLLPRFQTRLAEITGIRELGFIHPDYLVFQEYRTGTLQNFFNRVRSNSDRTFSRPVSGDRIEWKAHTHVGLKPLFISNKTLPHLNELREIYWLNTNNYVSNGETLRFGDGLTGIQFCEDQGYWNASLEDMMKMGFADYMTYKTYRPSCWFDFGTHYFTLPYFSYLYLIDYIGYGPENIETNQTTAYAHLHFTCCLENNQIKERLEREGVPLNSQYARMKYLRTPEDILLKLEVAQYSREPNKVLKFEGDTSYKYYKINPLAFIPYLQKAYEYLEDTEKTPSLQMFQLVYSKALNSYVEDYRKENFYLGRSQTEELVNSLCILHGIDKARIGDFSNVERLYLKDFNALLLAIKDFANTQYDLH